MRILATLLVLLALLWSGAWFAAARMAERAAETWFAEAAADGLLAGYDHLAVSGFPARLALRVEAPRLADPLADVGWAAGAVTAATTLAAPGRLRILPQGAQTLRTEGQRIDITAGALAAEARLRAPDLAPAAAALQGAEVVLLGTPTAPEAPGAAGWTLRLATLAGDLGLTGAAPELTLSAEGVGIDAAAWPEAVAPRPDRPIRRLELAARGEFDAAVEAGGRLVALQLEALRLDWGDTRLQAAGRLEIGADGLPQGRITATAEGWRALLALAVATGLVAPELAPTWTRVIETLEAAGPETARAAGRLEVPVVFQRGRVSLGPLPLGRAPVLAPPLPAGG